MYSDFASHSVDFAFNVNSGTVENLTLTSDSAFGLNGGIIGLLTKKLYKGMDARLRRHLCHSKWRHRTNFRRDWRSGALTKAGTGTLTLSGTNDYSGDTTINAGMLELAATGSLTSAVTVADTAGATFALRGNVTGDVTLAGSNSTLNAYQGGEITGKLDATNGKLNFYLPQTVDTTNPLLDVNGNVNVTGSTITIRKDGDFGSFTSLSTGAEINIITATGTLDGFGSLSYTPVPLYVGIAYYSTALFTCTIFERLCAR
ncbi:hypothetical protein FACS1894116_11320 [Betaproteobacteria bacterium]|nr:hypothetical protein FACS1894116_11320 [Betaproteobacteria bacterium]